MHFVMSFGSVRNGWSSTAAYPAFGDDYWFRATANFGGIWWNSSNEAVYEMLHTDADGNDTTGSSTYTMRFEPGQTPDTAVHAFWSLTVYGKPDYMLVANPLSRYSLSYRSDLTMGDDGSLTIYFAPDCPQAHPPSNWLPTPQANRSPPTSGSTCPPTRSAMAAGHRRRSLPQPDDRTLRGSNRSNESLDQGIPRTAHPGTSAALRHLRQPRELGRTLAHSAAGPVVHV